MTYIRSPFDLLHGAPPGLAVLPEYEATVERATTIKRAAFLALIRKRLRIRNPQLKKKED